MVCITEYLIVKDSAISCDFVKSATECESAANKLGLADITVEDDGQDDYYYYDNPPFCYYYYVGGILKYNNLGINTGPCTSTYQCLCRKNDFCAKFSCGDGQGDCDNDTECEGSLVCGHMNCVNSTISDCCTQPCNNGSDCAISGECNTENNQCYLWPECSQDSPCADGEGDCDHHTDCEGTLLCGYDNCASGPKGMDCCTDDGN